MKFESAVWHRIAFLGGSIFLVASIAIALWPVTVSAGVGVDSVISYTSISCGSPLFKSHPVYDAPFKKIQVPPFDECSRTRDHRRLPVKVLGGAGLMCIVAGVGILWRRKDHSADAS